MCIKGLEASSCSSLRYQPPASGFQCTPMDRGKMLCGFVMLAALVWEPTLSEGNRPSSSYGPPGFGGNNGNGGSRPSSNYGPPSGPGGGGNGGGGYNVGNGGNGGNGGGGYNGGNGGNGEASPEPFSFSYEVKDPESGNDFSHRAESDGTKVNGEYRVLLPDGRKQIVTYTADDASGYNADVKYEGEANNGGGGGGNGGGYPSGGSGNGGYPSGGGNNGGGYPSGGGGNGNGYPSGGGGNGYPSGGGGNGYPSGGGGNGGGSPSSSYLPPGK